MGILHTQSSSEDMWNLYVPVAPQENSDAKLILFAIMVIYFFFHRKKTNMLPTSISIVSNWKIIPAEVFQKVLS